MDPELIIYLIFLAIIFLSRLLKKPSQKSSGTPPQQQSQRPQRPAKSFEELLEEFTGQTGEREEVMEEEYSEREPEEEAPSYQAPEELRRYHEVPDYSTNYESYGGELKTLDEMVDINEVRTTTKITSADEEDEVQPGTEWQDMLRDPGDARRAIILSEIIRRRY